MDDMDPGRIAELMAVALTDQRRSAFAFCFVG